MILFTWSRVGLASGITLAVVSLAPFFAVLLGVTEAWTSWCPLLALLPCTVLTISSGEKRRLALTGLAIAVFSASVLYGVLFYMMWHRPVDFHAPLGLMALALLSFSAWTIGVIVAVSAGLKALLASFRARPGFCKECGYDLTGSVSGICPECGRHI